MSRPATCFYWKARGCFATDLGGKRTVLVKGPKTKANRELALQRLGELLANRPDKELITPDKVTVTQLIDWFLAHSAARVAAAEIKASTLDQFYKPYGRLIKKECGHWLANRITEDQLLAYRADLNCRDLSPATVKNRLVTLRVIMRWAQGKYINNSVRIATGPGRRREHIPTADEMAQLLVAARPDVADVLTMLLNCPVRPDDIFSLRRTWVDVDAGLFRLPDSKRGQRLVPIGQVPNVVEVLQRRLSTPSDNNDFVFTTVRGCPWHFRYFGQQVRKAREKAGLGKHVIAYACRHFWTTQALLNGVPLETVKDLRGDRDVSTTLHYSHIASHLNHLQQAARQAVGLPAEDESHNQQGQPDESE